MKYLLFILLLVVVLITAGCTSGNQNVVAAPTAPTITTIPTPTPTLIQTTVITPIPNVTIIKNVVVKPTATQDTPVIDDIVFLTFADRFVSIKYPNTWTAETKSESDIKLPWWTDDKLFERIEIVNPAKTVTYTITMWDIGAGAWRMNDGTQWWYDEVQSQFPEHSSRSITGYDKKCMVDKISSCMKYTVTIPNEIKLFRYRTCTLHYGYTFELISTDAATYDAYKNLGEYMTNTIKISDTRTT